VRPLASVLAVLLLAGCSIGGGDHPKREVKAEHGEEGGRRLAEKRLPTADRIAFYQLTTSLGLVHARATAAAQGRSSGLVGTNEVKAATKRIGSLKPRNRTLARCRDELLRSLALAGHRKLDRPAARRALRDARRSRALLNEYAHAHGEVLGLVPD
jgi:hypothetical protein